MQKGQIGTATERRMIFVWEGAVATLPDSPSIRALERCRMKLGQWKIAVDYWQVNDFAIQWMWSIFVRTEFRTDIVVTQRMPRFAAAVAHKVERENWPVRFVFATPAPVLGRQLVRMPDVERVIYALDEHRWTFGPQGLCLTQAGQIV